MKTNQIFRLAIVALFFTLSLGACKKESDITPKTRIVFWSKRVDVKAIKADCYVDGQLVGTLTTATATAPLCGTPGSVSADVTPGTHTIKIKLASGDSVEGDVDAPEGQCRTVEVN
jgi:hypothetical protein